MAVGSILGIASAGNVAGSAGVGSGGGGSRLKLLSSPTFVFFFSVVLLLGSIASLYAWLFFTPYVRTPYIRTGLSSLGCIEDNEGSWSIGVFYGDSPFSLHPIENMTVWRDGSSAWPVANPVVT